MFVNQFVKDVLGFLALLALFMAASFMAPHEAHAKDKIKPIPIIGKTADGRYPIYDLKGELSDFNYFTDHGNTVYTSAELIGRMGYAKPEAGKIVCDYVCKDTANHIVGIHEGYRFLEKK